jgi:hypothetical protein
MMMLKEYAVVRLTKSVAACPLPIGARGVILIVYPDSPQAYEVEFVGNEGESLGTYTVEESSLEEEVSP